MNIKSSGQLSLQEMFDKTCTLFKEQRIRCYSRELAQCVYNGPNNTHCAVGNLIPEEIRNTFSDLDNQLHIEGLFEARKDVADYLGVNNIKFLNELQAIHDHNEALMNPLNALDMISLASRYNLNSDKVDW